MPFICNHGHYRTSTIEGIFQNFACPTCKSSSSRLYPIQVEKIYKKLPSDDPKRRKPNIQLAKKILKWEPKVTFKNGLIKTIDYYKKNNE